MATNQRMEIGLYVLFTAHNSNQKLLGPVELRG